MEDRIVEVSRADVWGPFFEAVAPVNALAELVSDSPVPRVGESGPWPLLGALMCLSSHMYMSTVKGSCRLGTSSRRLTSARTPERHAALVVCVGSVRRGSRSVKVTKNRATSRR
jgi:hypothetical protein